ncbi:MAG: hypothetical protein ACYSU7_06915 [Planctomycetota bacterium]|jgi:hypothetical protein
MPQAWKFARVEFDASSAGAVFSKLVGWAAMAGAGPDKGPGLTQNESVQFAAQLASLRTAIARSGKSIELAAYDGENRFVRTLIATPESELDPDLHYFPIVGTDPVPAANGGELGKRWGADLVLAIDRLLAQIAKSERAGEAPAGYGAAPMPGIMPAALPVAAIAVLVGGAAVAVIGTAAVWRYLDPEVRTRAAAVTSAAQSYQARILAAQTTGVMPPPSPIEVATAEIVQKAAGEQRTRYYLYGAAALAGIGGGAALVSYLRRAA